jgi:hypothetical protein
MFCDCVLEGHQPEMPFDIHSAIAMSSVAILSHRSMLEGGKPYDIPDYHNEADRARWENDRATPFWNPESDVPALPVCSHTDYAPTEKQLELYRSVLGI